MTRDYSSLFEKGDAYILQDADNAVTVCELWDWLKTYTPHPNDGFVFAEHPNLTRINKELKYNGHSGASYGWTMRQMEYIAKHGWESYSEMVLRRRQEKNLLAKLDQLKNVTDNAAFVMQRAFAASNGNPSPLDIAEATRGVPGFEGQADVMKDFSEGKISYSEMRSRCG